MLFNSILFLAFFAVVLPLFYLIYFKNLSPTFRRRFLIIASLVFYAAWGLEREGWWGLRWTLHFVGIAYINFLLIRMMHRNPDRKKGLIRFIVILDLLNLGTFKYFAFMRGLILDMGISLPEEAKAISIFLPLAISFYSFQMIAYAVDVYRGDIEKEEGAERFMFFILFFPQLIAGPIMRSTDFLAQMDKPEITRARTYGGLWLIIGGLCKKVLMADPIGIILAPVYAEPHTYSWFSILLASYAFALQVYCDFSGYTDIARGCARLLGYEIPENFRAPFFALSVRELWNRWHITLSTWLRDYIYFPLGGSRAGALMTYVNLIITFTLAGLWHGADYNFVIWGAFFGLLLAVERLIERIGGWDFSVRKGPVLNVARAIIVFSLFSISAVMFRAQPVPNPDNPRGPARYTSVDIMGEMSAGLFTNTSNTIRNDLKKEGFDVDGGELVFGDDVFAFRKIKAMDALFFMFLALFFFNYIQYRRDPFANLRKYDFWLLIIVGAIVGGILMPSLATGAHQFIYFVF